MLAANVEESNCHSDENDVLEAPESVLNRLQPKFENKKTTNRSWILRCFHTEHHDCEDEEEGSHCGAEAVDRLEAGGTAALKPRDLIETATEPVCLKQQVHKAHK